MLGVCVWGGGGGGGGGKAKFEFTFHWVLPEKAVSPSNIDDAASPVALDSWPLAHVFVVPIVVFKLLTTALFHTLDEHFHERLVRKAVKVD